MGNDISNLLSKFGATVDGYLEIEAAINYKEPSASPRRRWWLRSRPRRT